MDIERAKGITAACVATCVAPVVGRPRVPLPRCSLADMLEANRIVGELPEERKNNGDGTGSFILRMRVDPHLIAAHYALESYGGEPGALLKAVGFELQVARQGKRIVDVRFADECPKQERANDAG